jgi:hypothetical protein
MTNVIGTNGKWRSMRLFPLSGWGTCCNSVPRAITQPITKPITVQQISGCFSVMDFVIGFVFSGPFVTGVVIGSPGILLSRHAKRDWAAMIWPRARCGLSSCAISQLFHRDIAQYCMDER